MLLAVEGMGEKDVNYFDGNYDICELYILCRIRLETMKKHTDVYTIGMGRLILVPRTRV